MPSSIDKKKISNILEPPFQVDPMLFKNPSFKTTHTSEYTTSPRNKYSNVQSKFKMNRTK